MLHVFMQCYNDVFRFILCSSPKSQTFLTQSLFFEAYLVVILNAIYIHKK